MRAVSEAVASAALAGPDATHAKSQRIERAKEFVRITVSPSGNQPIAPV